MNKPFLFIQKDKIIYNTKRIIKEAKNHGIEIVGVTKGAAAYGGVVEGMAKGGIKIFADSRLENLSSIKGTGLAQELYLLRLPMMQQVKQVVELVDLSFNSQETTLKALSQEALSQGKIHKVMLMVDVGDLREGVMPHQLLPLVEKTLSLRGIQLEGLATNVGCYGGVLPSRDQLKLLLSLSSSIKETFGYQLKKISGGNTATTILFSQGLPKGINQLRIGEGILVGFDSTNQRALPGFNQDTFILHADIIEIQEKPSYPQGKIGRDAFGEIPHFLDKGIRKRAILAIGRQDVDVPSMTPLVGGVEILGGSSDHLILDISDCQRSLKVGDTLPFSLAYPGVLRVMTSPYVYKVSKD